MFRPVLLLLTVLAGAAFAAPPLSLPARDASNANQTIEWEPTKTALIICDMWDAHWCPGATARVAEMAPRLNEFAKAARNRGVLIIHCPSGTLDFYKDHPGRKLAMSAPKVEPPVPLNKWCRIDLTAEVPLPIDDSDGGCDTPDFTRDKYAPNPWTREIIGTAYRFWANLPCRPITARLTQRERVL